MPHPSRPVTKRRVDQHITGQLVPNSDAVAFHCLLGAQNERQLFVIDLDTLGRVERRRPGLGHDHCDGFTNVTHLVGRQQHVRPDENVAAARTG